MVSDADYKEKAKRLLKAKLKERGFSYKQLAEKLVENGMQDSAENIANKLSRGSFSAAFLLRCMDTIGAKKIDLDLE